MLHDPQEHPDRSPEAEEERKERVLTKGKPSITRSIANAIVIKDGRIFFLSEPDGRVPLDRRHGLGLYHQDCRFLNGYELHLAGVLPNLLVSSAAEGFSAMYEYSNPDIRMEGGGVIPAQDMGITLERTADGGTLSLHDRIVFHNFGLQTVEFPISIAFRADFEDVYQVRGLISERPGTVHPPEWKGDVLRFHYDGADGILRSTTITFAPAPARVEDTTAHFHLHLGPGEKRQVTITVQVNEARKRGPLARSGPSTDVGSLRRSLRNASDEAVARKTCVHTDGILINRILDRSFRDLHMLRNCGGGECYYAAGLPWFGTLFGRDTLVTSLEMLAYDPEIAAETLRVLAAHQGTKVDAWRDEEPGKILHELRSGELAHIGAIPHTPYYGTVDATPLFLILLGRHAAWTGDLALFHELRDNVKRALEWIDRYGDLDGDGYIEYHSTSKKGLVNQGWKDSGDAIVNVDGTLAVPPIALVEVQGYVYLAKRLIAGLYRRVGEEDDAQRLDREADALRERFNRDFWLEDEGIYALALQAEDRPAAVVSSNPGHALWAGIADPDKAARTAERLMADDMFSGWGVRTLSAKEKRYNPIGYHLGTVWPHDNAIIAAGFRRYGQDRAALRIFEGIVQAVLDFEHLRLPELLAGFSRDEFRIPVRYPVACHPQAWAAGSIPYMLESLLGLVPEAFERRLRIVRPLLPNLIDRLRVEGLRVGDARADLRFERTHDGVNVQVVRCDGDLDIVIQQGSTETAPWPAP